ncbi:YjdF family protein [Anaerosporobacter faecicola]|uniref:YjdF family protein n=1 Tax=Anaerosporobacter faecicola TaxID=2718714 RepID=UPI00143C3311|nr:YjdF family protein [Anaerosporobacter faecicola]
MSNICLQVYFEEPFWVGVFERVDHQALTVCKVTFGAEPTEPEVLQAILKRYDELRFSPSVSLDKVKKKTVNPKRLQREVHKQMNNVGIGTKSMQALKLQQEACKVERKRCSKEEKEKREEMLYLQKQQKRKEKHRGR